MSKEERTKCYWGTDSGADPASPVHKSLPGGEVQTAVKPKQDLPGRLQEGRAGWGWGWGDTEKSVRGWDVVTEGQSRRAERLEQSLKHEAEPYHMEPPARHDQRAALFHTMADKKTPAKSGVCKALVKRCVCMSVLST